MRLSEKLDRLSSAISEIRVNVARNTVTLERNTADVEKHISRTETLEAQLDELKKEAAFWARVGRWAAGGATALAGAVLGAVARKLLG